MADYYPLLAKAAAGLSGATPETRQAMYGRARKALLGQLRAIDPPVAEDDISRESAALEAAIARVEAEFFPSAAPPPSPIPEPPAAPPPPPAPPAPPPVAVSPPKSAPSPVAPPPVSPPAPAPTPPEPAPPTRSSPEPAPEPAADSAPNPADTATPKPAEAGATAPAEDVAEPEPAEEKPAGEHDLDLALPGIGEKRSEPFEDRPDLRVRPRERPLAPKPPEPAGPLRRVWILGGVAAVLVAAVAAAALKLRDSPEDLARLKPVAAPTAEPTPSGKIAERVGRDESAQTTQPQSPAQAPGTPAAPAQTPAQPAVTQPPIPVAQRAALLVEAPDLESKVRTFIGSTVWRLDNVSASAGQPLGTAVHADVEIPDAKVRLTLDFRKNTDAALPASATIEVRFTLLPGSVLPGIKQISVPQMRREENPNGDALAGVPVKITDTYFLIGLAQGDFEKRNADLIRSRSWIDIPVQLTDNRIAKFTIEKGTTGDRILSDALDTWAQ